MHWWLRRPSPLHTMLPYATIPTPPSGTSPTLRPPDSNTLPPSPITSSTATTFFPSPSSSPSVLSYSSLSSSASISIIFSLLRAWQELNSIN
ncbi:hypothetical protein TorRG33x02_111730 [Trema orientale]|uniref:Uncharacterized protein n=1 Tax=Trema orientale TaxID=63057 RepID=A0A2P5F544_TREOI|nr:hypothetical protein TorRG33x02_111730 [Trema orientale]